MSSREHLLQAAKELMWERGYSAMSPRDVLNLSGVGQGSLYHHFTGKCDLAGTAISEVASSMRAEAEAVLSSNVPPMERVRGYLTRPRDALLGCRLGRLAYDPEVVSQDVLHRPVMSYFMAVEQAVTGAIHEAQHAGALPTDLDAENVASTLVAVVQGGYVLARATGDAAQLDRAVSGALALLERVTGE